MTISDDIPEENNKPTWEEIRDNPALFVDSLVAGDILPDYQRKLIERLMSNCGVELHVLQNSDRDSNAATSRLQEHIFWNRNVWKRRDKE